MENGCNDSNYKLIATVRNSRNAVSVGTVTWFDKEFSVNNINDKINEAVTQALQSKDWKSGVYRVEIRCLLNDVVELCCMTIQYTSQGEDSSCVVGPVEESSIVNPLGFLNESEYPLDTPDTEEVQKDTEVSEDSEDLTVPVDSIPLKDMFKNTHMLKEPIKDLLPEVESPSVQVQEDTPEEPKKDLFKVKSNKELGRMESSIIQAIKGLIYKEKAAHNMYYDTETLTLEKYFALKKEVLVYSNCPNCEECAKRLGMSYSEEDKVTPCSKLDLLSPTEATKVLKKYSYQKDVVTNRKILEALFGEDVFTLFQENADVSDFLDSEYILQNKEE